MNPGSEDYSSPSDDQTEIGTLPCAHGTGTTGLDHKSRHHHVSQCIVNKPLLTLCPSNQQEFDRRPEVIAPWIVKTKGHPQQKRLTSAIEKSNQPAKRSCFEGFNDEKSTTAARNGDLSEAVTVPCKTVNVHHCHKCGQLGHYTITCWSHAKAAL